MGRYESQRAIAARTISDPAPRRKRADWQWSAVRRLAAIVLTVGALLIASWLSQRLRRPVTLPAAAPSPPTQVELLDPKTIAVAKTPPAAEPAPQPRRARARRSAAATTAPIAPDDGIEILSAAELAGISQAQ